MHFEVFYFANALRETNKGGGGWFWWPRQQGLPPEGPATGAFATSYAAYRDAMIGTGVHWRRDARDRIAVGA
ncbi:hypothetical protein ACQR1I_31265 [Bradyrhizobium sp. HKCCYLS2038]|uniref:hypothetical protein n=1 Tax=unclassified Bradyrhizobium TaxID=2631580 RepID=UPI003EB9D030